MRLWRRSPNSFEPAVQASIGDDPLRALVERAQGGDRGAAHELLLALGPALLRVARQVLGGSHPDVGDVAQEAAFGVLTALDRFRGECSIKHFACRIAVLAAMNARRREHSQSRKTEDLRALRHDAHGGGPQATPEHSLLEERAAAAVRELLGTLPRAQAEALGLHHVLGLSVAEIAAATGTPAETVRSRLRLGRQALRERVQEDPRLCRDREARTGNA